MNLHFHTHLSNEFFCVYIKLAGFVAVLIWSYSNQNENYAFLMTDFNLPSPKQWYLLLKWKDFYQLALGNLQAELTAQADPRQGLSNTAPV